MSTITTTPTTTPTTVNTASLMLQLSFEAGPQSGQHEDCTKEICESRKASRKYVTVSARYVPKEAHAPINTLKGLLMNEIKDITRPAGIKSCFTIKGKYMEKFVTIWNNYIEAFNALKKDHLIGRWQEWYDMTAEQEGDAFQADKFPSREQMAAECNWTYTPRPISEAEALRLVNDIAPGIVDMIVHSADEKAQKLAEANRLSAYQGMSDYLLNMVKVLDGDKPIIHETLVENLRNAASNMDAINFTNDPKLNALAAGVAQMVEGLTKKDLKANPILRAAKVEEAKSLLASFGKPGLRKFTNAA